MASNQYYGQKGVDNEGYEMNASRYDIDSSAPNNYPNPLIAVGATNPLGPENGGYGAQYYETMQLGATYTQPSALPAIPGEGAVPPAYSVNRDQLIARKADSCSKKRIFIILFSVILLVIVSISIGISAFHFVANSSTNTELTSMNEKVNILENTNTELTSKVNTLANMIAVNLSLTNRALTSINEKVNTLENTLAVNFSFAKVNFTRVNLFQNCYDEVASCTIRSTRNPYWHFCSTPYKSINITVS